MQSTHSYDTRGASASRGLKEQGGDSVVPHVDPENSQEVVDPVVTKDPVTYQSTVSLTRELVELGKEMGLEGTDLQDFVKEEKDNDREERERERQFQIEQLRIRAETNPNSNDNNNRRRRGHDDDDDDHFFPKIPFLDDKDDIESWFQQFEHYAQDCKLSEDKKASRMIYFLKGKARVIYSKLSIEEARDYEILKNALFEGFQLNAEEYRKKFRSAKRGSSETYKELVTRLARYLDRWVELDKGDVSVKKLKDLILKEQVIEIIPS